jgi:hypothetical protein
VYRLARVSGGCSRRSLPAMLLVLGLSSSCCGSRKRRGYMPLHKTLLLITVVFSVAFFVALDTSEVKQNTVCFMQKDTQPNQMCSGGHIAPNPTLNGHGRCLFAYEEYKLDYTRFELELIQTHMTQKPMLRVEVGAVSCSRCACVAHKGHARENRRAWASAALKAFGCVCPCLRL